MSWQQLTLVIDASKVETLSALLEVFLAQAITTENAGDDDFYEVAFPGTPDWQTVRVTALFNDQIDLSETVNFIHQHFQFEIPVSIAKLVEQDWERVWLDSFKPVKVGHKLWVCPSWCEPLAPKERNIVLDPGLAFGTGTHATTGLCLDWLAKQDLRGQRVLDYGAGSGILAIGALLCGAQHATAIDIDPLAVNASVDNGHRNGVSDRLTVCLANHLNSNRKFELVIANILADVIIELSESLLHHLDVQNQGTLLLTGILTSQVERVEAAFDPWLTFKVQQRDQWCMLISRT